jgi:hypothetical protein
MTLLDLPLKKLLRMLRDTLRFAGPDSPSVAALRRAVEAKRAALRQRKEVRRG